MMVHGHLAPARASDVTAMSRRFDKGQLDASTTSFGETLKARFSAHLGDRAEAKASHRIVPRRLDFRHLGGPRFFAHLRPAVRTVAFLRERLLHRVVPPLLEWLDAGGVNVEIRDQNEFVTPEQALLVMQACAVIVGGPSMLHLSAQRCGDLGLLWATGAPRLIILDPTHTAPDRDMIYPQGPELIVARNGEHLVAAISACL
jgi:hypothetical protein